VTQPDKYLLGRGEAEEARLKRQIADLAPDSDAQFEKIGIKPGERVVDFGCGTAAIDIVSSRGGRSILGLQQDAQPAAVICAPPPAAKACLRGCQRSARTRG
jgi:hypothetical protein